jgi:hypothetical protein
MAIAKQMPKKSRQGRSHGCGRDGFFTVTFLGVFELTLPRNSRKKEAKKSWARLFGGGRLSKHDPKTTPLLSSN